jgi:predicted peroxiredoxin
VIVGCTHGEEDSNRVLVAYLTAGAALDQGKEVVMWLTAEGVRLALRSEVTQVTDTIRNGVDTEEVFATLDLIKAQPELATFELARR